MLDFIPHMLQGSQNDKTPLESRVKSESVSFDGRRNSRAKRIIPPSLPFSQVPTVVKSQRMARRGIVAGNSLPRYRTRSPTQLVSGQRLQPQNGYTSPDSTLNFEIQ